MLKNIKQVEGKTLRANDGTIGEVKDVYFDDQDWTVRYLVVETGAWLKQRKVLISPGSLGSLEWEEDAFPVDLTVGQVRNSPDIDTAKPVSRQHEAALRGYYGWPMYWGAMGDAVISPSMIPPVEAVDSPRRGVRSRSSSQRETGDPSLRSAKDTRGHDIEATDGSIGHVEDFLVDDEAWLVRYLVIDTGNWLPGKKVLVAPAWIEGVDWEKRRVRVDLTRSAIKDSPPYDPASEWDRDYAAQLHDYYSRARYSDWDGEIKARVTNPKRSR